MQTKLMEFLACPIDKHYPLQLQVSKQINEVIQEGKITCPKCHRTFPIQDGIPTLLGDEELSLPEKWWALADILVVANFMRSTDPHEQPIRCRIRDESKAVGNSVLDVGCATCIDYPLFQEAGVYYVGVDFTRRFLVDSSKYAVNVPVVHGNGRLLPFREEAFDSVYCKDFLIHLPPMAYKQVLHEMWRVTKKLMMIGFFGHAVDTATKCTYKLSPPGSHGPVYASSYPKAVIVHTISSLPGFDDLKIEHVDLEGYPGHPHYRSFYIARKK